ncbi:MAG: ABC transporter substrate-binding protein [Candidatus Wolfebacteria bacterium]|nr:ABC transporter substrate-binding protein [Candidatus Wolfebacteria bacterium]
MLKLIFNSFSKKERIAFLAALAVFVLSFITRTSIAVEEQSVLVPVEGGTYREGIVGQPVMINPIVSRNPADLDLSSAIYSTLGDLATNHEIEKDGRVHTIKIEEGQKWSNGTPLTSDDIIFTIQTIQNPDTKSPLFKNWEGVIAERVSELQIRFTLQAPYAFFEESMGKLPIIPEHIFGKIPAANLSLSSYNLEPVGSGPYKFKSFSKRKDGFIKEFHLVPNKYYGEEGPFLKNLYFVFFENERDLLRAFRFRQISGFGSANPNEKVLGEARNNTTTSIVPMSRYYAVFFNENVNPILKSEALRTALRDAIDKEDIVRKVFPAMTASAIDGPVVTVEKKGNEGKLSKEEVQAAIEKRKKAEGRIALNLVIPDVDFLEQTASMIKERWESVGVDEVNILKLSSEDLLENVLKPNNYEMLLFGNIAEIPEDVFPFWNSKERFYPGLNLSLYKNTRADTLMESIRQSGSAEERKELVEELQSVIENDTPAIFLYSLPYVHIHTNKLKGFITEESIISSPSERLRYVARWHVKTARVVEDSVETQKAE